MAEKSETTAASGLKPSALTPLNAAGLLTKASGNTITVDVIEADLVAGAPANADGTINLLHCAAWLVREMAEK